MANIGTANITIGTPNGSFSTNSSTFKNVIACGVVEILLAKFKRASCGAIWTRKAKAIAELGCKVPSAAIHDKREASTTFEIKTATINCNHEKTGKKEHERKQNKKKTKLTLRLWG